MDAARWMTHSLRSLRWGEQVGRVLTTALDAVEPGAAVSRHLLLEGNTLIAGEATYDLNHFARIFLIGAGKASVPMGTAAAGRIGERLTNGLLVTKDGYEKELSLPNHTQLEVLTAGHPLPDERGQRAAGRLEGMLSSAGKKDLIIFLISGGASALLPSPVEGVSLADLQALTGELLACGASIVEINTLRKHLDRLKGGRAAQLAYPATVMALILSDVVGDPLGAIASGPCAPDPTTFNNALAILQRYRLEERCPPAIMAHINLGIKGLIPETPKPGNPLFERVQNLVVGSNYLAARAAADEAAYLGWNSSILTTLLQGEAREAGSYLAAIAHQVHASSEPLPRPACLIAGGETTVKIRGGGLGGRNQELALSAVTGLAGMDHAVLVALATDGGDGPTDAAGAVVTGDTLARARQIRLDPADFLDRNDSYHFFAQLDDLLLPGPTQTNVNDLALLFVR